MLMNIRMMVFDVMRGLWWFRSSLGERRVGIKLYGIEYIQSSANHKLSFWVEKRTYI
jgi:hypothetical protein